MMQVKVKMCVCRCKQTVQANSAAVDGQARNSNSAEPQGTPRPGDHILPIPCQVESGVVSATATPADNTLIWHKKMHPSSTMHSRCNAHFTNRSLSRGSTSSRRSAAPTASRFRQVSNSSRSHPQQILVLTVLHGPLQVLLWRQHACQDPTALPQAGSSSGAAAAAMQRGTRTYHRHQQARGTCGSSSPGRPGVIHSSTASTRSRAGPGPHCHPKSE